jgi:hypothetical protein
MAQGQKFCGLRVAEAFFTTLIFMSLLRLIGLEAGGEE